MRLNIVFRKTCFTLYDVGNFWRKHSDDKNYQHPILAHGLQKVLLENKPPPPKSLPLYSQSRVHALFDSIHLCLRCHLANLKPHNTLFI